MVELDGLHLYLEKYFTDTKACQAITFHNHMDLVDNCQLCTCNSFVTYASKIRSSTIIT
eukprot:Pgem_evm1s12577